MDSGDQLTPYDEFKVCVQFFESKANAQNDDGLGEREAEEIDQFISKYENSAAITQVLWQLYFLKLELQSEKDQLERLKMNY